MDRRINVLLSTLPGMGLPKTLCLPLPAHLSTSQTWSVVASLLPVDESARLCLTTLQNREILSFGDDTLAYIAGQSSQHDGRAVMLPMRMSAGLLGGKGGFGSQLRAAGGRMSSRKKRQNAELAIGSARNLDGRRLRTITEAKNLATYLATKPEMDRRQKEERRKRWEQVIELAEQREADMKSGKGLDGRRKGLSEEWIEEKEEIGENVKHAVKLAMAAHDGSDKDTEDVSDRSPAISADEVSEDDDEDDDEDPMTLDESDMTKLTREAEAGDADALWVLKHKLKIPASLLPKQRQQARKFVGFDDDDPTSSDEDDASVQHEDKGKAALKSS